MPVIVCHRYTESGRSQMLLDMPVGLSILIFENCDCFGKDLQRRVKTVLLMMR